MPSKTTSILALLAALAAQSASSSNASSLNPSGSLSADQIVNAFMQSESSGPLRATLSLSVLRSGQTSKTVMDIVLDGQGRSLVTIKSPAKLAGQAFLRLGNDIQMYNLAFKRVLPLPAGAQSDGFLGSDISIGDFSGGDFKSNFTLGKVTQTGKVASLDLLTKPDAPIPYGKVNLSVKLPSLSPQSITFFDQRGQAVKRLSYAAFQVVGGKSFPARLVVDDLLRRDSRTILDYSHLSFGPVPAACFTPAALPKGC